MYKRRRNAYYFVLMIVLGVVGCSSNSIVEEPAPLPVATEQEEIIVTGARSQAPPWPQNKTKSKEADSNKRRRAEDRDIHWSAERKHQIFRDYGVNPTIFTGAKPDSTFAIDVDDGSYKLAVEMLERGQMPRPEGIRVEEFVNAQGYRYLASEDDIGLSAEVMPSPFRPNYHVLHLGMQAKKLNDSERLPANLVLVADVSGSMGDDNKIGLLKEAFSTLISQLRKDDRVAIVAYENNAHVVLRPTMASKKRKIAQAIASLKTAGSTNASAGIQLAYKIASRMHQSGFINRVILTSDGMANLGATMPEDILANIKKYRQKGIFLTTVGVGVGMYNDALLEQLANQGDGSYLYFGNRRDIQIAFVDRLSTQLQTLAKNVKAQIHFNPSAISHYRLLGYENRALSKGDFLNTKKDGGEVGAGQRVTAVYEIRLTPEHENMTLGTFSVAYQKSAGQELYTIEKNLPTSIIRATAKESSSALRVSAAAAAFAEKLRKSYWSDLYGYQDISALLNTLPSSAMRSESLNSLKKAIQTADKLDRRENRYLDSLPQDEMNLDHVPLLK